MKTKHLITLVCIIAVVLTTNAQSGAKYATGGNSTSAGDIFGTTNAQPINFVTNNTLKMVLDVTGNLRLVNFAGTGNRIVLTDVNGNLINLPQGTMNQFLTGNGTWANLPASATTWSVNGNNLFSTNTGDVYIKSDFIFGNAGSLKNNAWTGTGNRLLNVDALGNVTPFVMGTSNQVLYGNGTWGSIPTPTVSGVWNTNGNNLYYNGNVGINKTNPTAALDINGDLKVSNNLYVGGGIVITDAIRADTIRMDSLSLIRGNTNIDGDLNATGDVAVSQSLSVGGDVSTNSKLTVGGNATFNGNLKLANLIGSGDNIVYADANGNLKINTPGPGNPPIGACLQGAKPWYVGGNINGANSVVGTCDNFDFILQSNSTQRVWIKPDGTISFGANIPSNTNGAEYKFHQGIVRLSGSNTFGPGPGMIFDGGVNPYGDWGLEYNATALTKPGLNFWKPFASTYSNNNILFLADDGMIGMGTDNPISRLTMDAWSGDGLRVISGVHYSKAISLNYKSGNTITENYVVNGDGVTWIGTNVSSVGSAQLVVGQPSATNKIMSLVNNGNPNPSIINDVFNVYGSGYTEIKVFGTGSLPGPNNRVFVIKDLTNQSIPKDIFVVRADGKTYAREVEISLQTTFPDYVFAKDYKLKTIDEVNEFIKTNKHLPGFEKGEFYEKNGINVNEMFVKQQEKMEEMMLYIIELEKRLKSIEEKK